MCAAAASSHGRIADPARRFDCATGRARPAARVGADQSAGAVEGTPLANTEALDPLEFVRTIAVARISMPKSFVRLSAGRQQMSDAVQALCFLAGANSIFYGEKLLTTGNPEWNATSACSIRWIDGTVSFGALTRLQQGWRRSRSIISSASDCCSTARKARMSRSTASASFSFCSNDYLGLAADPALIAAGHAALDQCGVGAGAAHLISGTIVVTRISKSRCAFCRQACCAAVFHWLHGQSGCTHLPGRPSWRSVLATSSITLRWSTQHSSPARR